MLDFRDLHMRFGERSVIERITLAVRPAQLSLCWGHPAAERPRCCG